VSFAARMIGAGESGVFLTRFSSSNFSFGYSSDVTVTANTNGTLTVVGNGNIFIGTITPNPGYYSPTTAAIGSNYQIRITPTAGSFSTGTVNSWLTISSARTWTVSTNFTKSVTFTIEIRNTASGTVLATTALNQIDCESGTL
jgi:hypothetical protein